MTGLRVLHRRMAGVLYVNTAGRQGDGYADLRPGVLQQVVDHSRHGGSAARDPRAHLVRASDACLKPRKVTASHSHGGKRAAQVVSQNGQKSVARPVGVVRIGDNGFRLCLVNRFVKTGNVIQHVLRDGLHVRCPQAEHGGAQGPELRGQLDQRKAAVMPKAAMYARRTAGVLIAVGLAFGLCFLLLVGLTGFNINCQFFQNFLGMVAQQQIGRVLRNHKKSFRKTVPLDKDVFQIGRDECGKVHVCWTPLAQGVCPRY